MDIKMTIKRCDNCGEYFCEDNNKKFCSFKCQKEVAEKARGLWWKDHRHDKFRTICRPSYDEIIQIMPEIIREMSNEISVYLNEQIF